MESAPQWAVSLSAEDQIDLRIAQALFEIGDPYIREITIFTGRAETALFSSQFIPLVIASEVAEASSPIIDVINGICFIHDRNRSPLKRSAIHERLPNGDSGGGISFASALIAGRSRAVAFSSVVDNDGNVKPVQQSPQSNWLQNAAQDEGAVEVLSYLRDTPDWFFLYKAFEAMKARGGGAAVVQEASTSGDILQGILRRNRLPQQSLHPLQHRGVIIDDENEVPIWQE
jgi:hypothetical protein